MVARALHDGQEVYLLVKGRRGDHVRYSDVQILEPYT
jgi:hypothetical protein